jgi:hypothetical protein
MKNLAGNKLCDDIISTELIRCKIPLRKLDKIAEHSEVPYTVYGELSRFTFKRAWYYYVIEGYMPLHLAEIIYADPVGKTDIRADGHCGCVPPIELAHWFNKFTGRRLHKLIEKEQAEKILATLTDEDKKLSVYIELKKFLTEREFVERPDLVGTGYISCYHIDTEIGLRLFADTIQECMGVCL